MAMAVVAGHFTFALPGEVEAKRRSAVMLMTGSMLPSPAWAGDVFGERLASKAKEKARTKVDDQGRALVAMERPTGTKRKLYYFELPLVKGKTWGDYSRDDPRETGTILKGPFGNKTENGIFQTQVIAGKLEDEMIPRIREGNYTSETGVISDVETKDTVDLEWTDYEKRRYTKYKIHNFMRVIRAKEKNQKDIVVFLQVPEPQLENLRDLWPPIRDSFQMGNMTFVPKNDTATATDGK